MTQPTCKRGHARTPSNCRKQGRRTICKVCARDYQRLWRQQQRQESPKRGASDALWEQYVARRKRLKCPQGHPYTRDNTYLRLKSNNSISVTCRQCQAHWNDLAYKKRAGLLTVFDILKAPEKKESQDPKEQERQRIQDALRDYNRRMETNRKAREKRGKERKTMGKLCIHGHKMTKKNTGHFTNRQGKTQKVCRACAAERQRVKRALARGRSSASGGTNEKAGTTKEPEP